MDMSRGLGGDISGTLFPGIPRLEDDIHLFQGTAFCLHKEEINKDKLEDIPKDKKDIALGRLVITSTRSGAKEHGYLQPVFDVFHCNRSGEGVDETSTTCSDLKDHHSICAHVICSVLAWNTQKRRAIRGTKA